jgi:S1-C subfamily serine protease
MLTDRRAVPLLVAAIVAWSLVLTSRSTAQEAVTLDELAKVRSVEASRIAVIDKVYHTVVAIYGLSRQGGGSGVVYDPAGYVLTNYHVTAGAGVEGWGGLADGKLYKWKLVGHDPGGDIAIIKLEGPTPDHQFQFAQLADSETVRVGDFAMAMGNPFILAEDQTPTVTLGIVSGVKRYQAGTGPGGKMLEYGNCIQVDSSINPGNSGGPLFNMKGQVIGINGRGSFEERGRVNVGLGYAISANQIKMFIPELLAAKTCEHGTLEAVFNRRGNNEVVCESINLDSPLAKAGFELGDRLLKFNGQEMKTTHEFTNTIATLPANWPVEVVWDHDGTTKSAWVRLTPILYPKPPAPPQPRPVPFKPPTPEPKPNDKGKEKKPDDAKTPEKTPAKTPDEKQPESPPKPMPRPATAGEEKTSDGFGREELTQKLKRLEEVRAALTDKPEALKEVDARIAEVKAKLKELDEKKEPAKPEDSDKLDFRIDPRIDEKQDEPKADPAKEKDAPKNPAKDAPKEQPKETPKPPAPPQPIVPAPPQGAPMEFGKVMNPSINEREALRILGQYQQYMGAMMDQVKVVEYRTETSLARGPVVSRTRAVLATDGRARVETEEVIADAGAKDKAPEKPAVTKSIAIWNASKYWQRTGGKVTFLEGDAAKRNSDVAIFELHRALLDPKPAQFFKRIVLQGSDKTQGSVAYRLLLEDKAGNRMIAWFSLMNRPDFSGDKFETRLMKVAFADDKDQPRDPAITYEGYGKVGAAAVSHRSRMVTGLDESTVTRTSVNSATLLRNVPAGAFDIPE